jgi:hypothetical protein
MSGMAIEPRFASFKVVIGGAVMINPAYVVSVEQYHEHRTRIMTVGHPEGFDVEGTAEDVMLKLRKAW